MSKTELFYSAKNTTKGKALAHSQLVLFFSWFFAWYHLDLPSILKFCLKMKSLTGIFTLQICLNFDLSCIFMNGATGSAHLYYILKYMQYTSEYHNVLILVTFNILTSRHCSQYWWKFYAFIQIHPPTIDAKIVKKYYINYYR